MKNKKEMSIMFEIINVLKANKIKACLLCECAQSFTVSGRVQFLYNQSKFKFRECNYFMFPQTNEKEMKLLRVN